MNRTLLSAPSNFNVHRCCTHPCCTRTRHQQADLQHRPYCGFLLGILPQLFSRWILFWLSGRNPACARLSSALFDARESSSMRACTGCTASTAPRLILLCCNMHSDELRQYMLDCTMSSTRTRARARSSASIANSTSIGIATSTRSTAFPTELYIVSATSSTGTCCCTTAFNFGGLFNIF